MKIKGRVHKYGDDINTDVIYPGKYVYMKLEPAEIASHALEDLDPQFVRKVKEGDILVAGKNFGMGSSREQAVTCLKYAGIRAIVAKSFSRIYFRNAINQGLPAIVSPEVVEDAKDGDLMEIDLDRGEIRMGKRSYKISPYPEKLIEILRVGGLIPYVKKIIKEGRLNNGKI